MLLMLCGRRVGKHTSSKTFVFGRRAATFHHKWQELTVYWWPYIWNVTPLTIQAIPWCWHFWLCIFSQTTRYFSPSPPLSLFLSFSIILSIYLSIRLSIYLFVHLFIRLSIYLFVYQSIYLTTINQMPFKLFLSLVNRILQQVCDLKPLVIIQNWNMFGQRHQLW